MKIYPHFLMIKSDGSIKDISKFFPITYGYAPNTDSNIETQTAFMMTNDMKLYACNYLTGKLKLHHSSFIRGHSLIEGMAFI